MVSLRTIYFLCISLNFQLDIGNVSNNAFPNSSVRFDSFSYAAFIYIYIFSFTVFSQFDWMVVSAYSEFSLRHFDIN